jgi:thioredoxin 1
MNTNEGGRQIIEVGEATFEAQVLKSDRPVMVAFSSPWSKPCQILVPVLEEVAQACAGRWKVVRVNADNHPALSLTYGVQSVPMLLYFVDGTLRAITVGTVSKEAIESQMQTASQTGDSTPHSPNGPN